MSRQLSFLVPDPSPVIKGGDRWAACRARVTRGCGGHHEMGPAFAGTLLMVVWHCCEACPARTEVATARAQGAAE